MQRRAPCWVLECLRDGLRAYLAVAGGIEAPLVMKSRSTDLKGGLEDSEDARLPPETQLLSAILRIVASLLPEGCRPKSAGRLHTVNTSISGWFSAPRTAHSRRRESTRCSTRSTPSPTTRTGPATDWRVRTIEHISGADIVSDGTALGSIQVPGGGTPIILLADRGTTGGYTKVATVISPDIGLIAQAMPGARIRFAQVTVEEAHQILLEQERMIAEIKAFVGLDLTGAFSVGISGDDFTVLDSDGRVITSPGTYSTNRATRQVSAMVEGERFDFEIEVATP